MLYTNGKIALMLNERNGIKVFGKNVIIIDDSDTGNDCCGSTIRLGNYRRP
ncbi:MAG: hypothetical protein K6G09_07055 [Treponema sp.]|nr:hypothetical protein [Treponema sp.]